MIMSDVAWAWNAWIAAALAAGLAVGPPVAALARSPAPVCSESAFTPDDAQDLGLRVCLTRAAPVFAVNEALELDIAAARDVSIEVWLMDAKGVLRRLTPADGGAPPLTIAAGTRLRLPVTAADPLRVGAAPGKYELRVVAKAVKVPTRSLFDADDRLVGRGEREERRLVLTVLKTR